MSNFGTNLKAARNEKGISQSRLAEMMGIHSAHVSRYERNLTIPSIDVLKKFADILEVSADALIYGFGSNKAKSKIKDNELLDIFNKAQYLKEDDINCIKSLLNAYIFQKDIQYKFAH